MSEGRDAVRVLHVDDEPGFAATAAEFLEREDDRLAVVTAESAEAALSTLAAEPVDCVVSDYEMPDRDGLELFEAVRERHGDLPFLLFTGRGNEAVAADAVSAGVTDYLQKGTGTEQYAILANRVVNAVEGHRATERARRQERISDLIREVNRKLVAAETVEATERAVCETLADSESYLFAWVGEPDGEGRVVPRTYAGGAASYLEDVEVRYDDTPRGRGPAGRAVRTREPQLVQPIEGNRSFEGWRDSTDRHGFEAVFVLPLVHDDTLHGVLPVYAAEKQAFDETEREVLEELAGTVSEALKAAKTRRRLRERERALAELHATATDITTVDTERAVCERTVEAARKVLDFDLCVIAMEEDGKLPATYASDAIPEGGAAPMSVEEGLVGRAYRTGESSLVADVQKDPRANPQGPYRGAVSVPIGEYGVFQAVSERPGVFDERDLELAETLVAYAETTLDRIEREAELRRQNDRLDEFVSIVSHDLRNPLNVAQARLALAAETGDDSHLDAVEGAHDRMEALVEDLLTLARQGDPVEAPDPVALAELVERCWATVSTEDATLEVDTEATLRADPGRLRQLLENLIRNAVEHGSTSPRSQAPEDAPEDGLTLTVGDCEGGFYVADDGPGIPDGEREQVFEAGYSTAKNGTGFGLRIVERVAEAHGWTVSVTDSGDGGARFEITGVEFV